MRGSASPKAPLERLAMKSGPSRRSSSLLFGAFLGASIAGLLACLVFMNHRTRMITSLVDCATGGAAAPDASPYSSSYATGSVMDTKEAEFSDYPDSYPIVADAALTTATSAPAPIPLSIPILHTPAVIPHDFWFVKTKKVGGSTLKGILNAVCAHHAITCMAMPKDENGNSIGKWDPDAGPAQIQHYRDLGFEHVAITDHGKYSAVLAETLNDPLLFTAVRDPVARFISQFFFHYRDQGEPGAPNLLTPTMEALSSGQPIPEEVLTTMRTFAEGEANLMFKDICDAPMKQSPPECVAPYDFIFVQEKFDESLVAFAIEYGLSLRDIAYTSAKNQTGKYPTESQLPPEIVDFIKNQNDKDSEVYRMGDAAMDARIAALRDAHTADPAGHTDFDAMLEEFKSLQAAVVAECSDHMQWYAKHGFHDGWFYSNDGGAVGEGYRCIDFVARRFEAGQRD